MNSRVTSWVVERLKRYNLRKWGNFKLQTLNFKIKWKYSLVPSLRSKNKNFELAQENWTKSAIEFPQNLYFTWFRKLVSTYFVVRNCRLNVMQDLWFPVYNSTWWVCCQIDDGFSTLTFTVCRIIVSTSFVACWLHLSEPLSHLWLSICHPSDNLNHPEWK